MEVKPDGNDGNVKVQESKIAKILVAFEWEWDGETLWYTGKASIPPAKSKREPPKNLQQFSNDCTDGLSVDFQWHESDNFKDCMNDMECQMLIHHPHVCLRNITFPLSDISVGVADQFLGVGQHRTSTKPCNVLIPSGYDQHSHGKSPFFIGKPSINGPNLYHGYVK